MFGAMSMSAAIQDTAGDPVPDLVPKIYAEIVSKAADRRFTRVTILYLDVKIRTRVAVTPQTLAKLGCRLEIPRDSPKWADLVAILRTEDVSETDRSSGEVRWGIQFYGNGNGSEDVKEVYFGPYYGPQSDGTRVFGYVDKVAVSFSAALPKKMDAYIQGTNCR
jgi:hypothetical protein